MADLADHAFAHTCAVLGPGPDAEEAAMIAVRRGGRSRSAVLGHARVGALLRASPVESSDLDAPAPEDLTQLASALVALRPALERSIADLDGRHDLDRGGFARALGLRVGPAGARAAAVFADWQQQLDPVLLARLGPAGCDGLAVALAAPDAADDADPTRPLRSSLKDPAGNSDVDGAEEPWRPGPLTLRELLQLAPAVADHAAGCAACGDRLRSMVSVRTLLGQRPIDGLAPPSVRAVAAPSRLRRPTVPPPLDPEPAARRWLRPVSTVAAALLIATAGGGIAAALRHDTHDDRQVEALTRVPVAGSALSVDPPSLDGTTPPPVVLANRADRAVEWAAEADVAWLRVTPSEGTLEPGAKTALRIGVTPEAPEGDVHGSVRVTGTDGSITVVRLAATVERPPNVAATALGCEVAATVDDDGEVRAVELHWRETGGSERVVALPADDAMYSGVLPNATAPMTWWVTASDARGNAARTPDENLSPGSCP
ncbi:MAG TPA: hypothetical protein VM143_15340 [Acidimicrobiales bacterium]|nr:hypothetical protein [Acidimicrobiales bacterium]